MDYDGEVQHNINKVLEPEIKKRGRPKRDTTS